MFSWVFIVSQAIRRHEWWLEDIESLSPDDSPYVIRESRFRHSGLQIVQDDLELIPLRNSEQKALRDLTEPEVIFCAITLLCS